MDACVLRAAVVVVALPGSDGGVQVRGQLSERELVFAAKESRGEARDALLEAFTPLIESVARVYRGASGAGREELMQ